MNKNFSSQFNDELVHGFVSEGTKIIRSEEFSHHESLETIYIPSGVEEIGDKAFFGCINLREVILPSSVKRIGRAAFYYCKKLTYISIPQEVEVIEDETFLECSLSKVVFANKVKSIGELSFAYNNLKEIVIPKSVENLSVGSLYKCKHIYVYDTLKEGLEYAAHNLHQGIATSAIPWCGHKVTVLDSITKKVKYSFYIARSLWAPARVEMMNIYDGAKIDFYKYDELFKKVNGAIDKVSIALSRLEDQYELDYKHKEEYIKALRENSKLALEKVIFDKDYKLLKLCEDIGLIDCENIDMLINYAQDRYDNAEIRTYLLNFKHKNCKRKRESLYL